MVSELNIGARTGGNPPYHTGRRAGLEEAIGREAVERYEAALARLRPEDRDAIVARIELERGYEQVANDLGAPSVAAARMAVGRALVRLAAEMNHR